MDLMYSSDRLAGPQVYEAGPDYQRGWAAGAIVSAIETLTRLLADVEVLPHVDESDDWDRRFAIAKARADVRMEIHHLRTALDVLDPRGTCSSRIKLAKIDAAAAAMTPNQGTNGETVHTEGDAHRPAPAANVSDGADSHDVGGVPVETVPVLRGDGPGAGPVTAPTVEAVDGGC